MLKTLSLLTLLTLLLSSGCGHVSPKNSASPVAPQGKTPTPPAGGGKLVIKFSKPFPKEIYWMDVLGSDSKGMGVYRHRMEVVNEIELPEVPSEVVNISIDFSENLGQGATPPYEAFEAYVRVNPKPGAIIVIEDPPLEVLNRTVDES